MASRKLFVILQALLISIILLAFEVAARELFETSKPGNPHHKMERELVNADNPWGHNPRHG